MKIKYDDDYVFVNSPNMHDGNIPGDVSVIFGVDDRRNKVFKFTSFSLGIIYAEDAKKIADFIYKKLGEVYEK